MGKEAARLGDLYKCEAHPPAPPLVLPVIASATVFINKIPALGIQPLPCGCQPIVKSTTVKIQGKFAVRKGDMLPAGTIQMGSPNVFIGD
ncbi:hypothetical protein KMW28_26765 [Flammeovirga yaeyamensis]|uniref:Type VI secretion protein n=1 Tax=Flammeovirga yaeyamensis TaxID=367791 RepID=A0AAX1NBE3_9BACT|nr:MULTISPECIES: hypothetical protein [Flammeovirga]ANQ52265.1 type VI secretion protein [Flammeovirga sp. MY04]MBB3701398.1 putative Zn-binding protein involved in type VI secretion [Flammeovirga yaeyamensis]NMF38644.1 type VI secretion protein [Flammeovirga yaeyamensis]QWG04502.1 hypothetical protein KMW28_26765 [Flammeovirga yaeyamensis]